MSKKEAVMEGSLSSGRASVQWFRRAHQPQLTTAELSGSVQATKPKGINNIIFILRFLATLLTITLVMGFLSWVLLGITVLPTPRIGSQMWAVQRSAWVQGSVPFNSNAFILSKTIETSTISRLKLLFSADKADSIQLIVAGPYVSVSQDAEGYFYINNKKTSIKTAIRVSPIKLNNDYLALCITGSCQKDTASTIPVDRVLGKVLGSVSIGGISKLPVGGGVR